MVTEGKIDRKDLALVYVTDDPAEATDHIVRCHRERQARVHGP
jgi:hypothetical protein